MPARGTSSAFQHTVKYENNSGLSGYHALYNGIAILKALKSESSLDSFLSDQERDNLFVCKNSKYKKEITLIRIKDLAKKHIADYLLKSLKDAEIKSESSLGCYKLDLAPLYIQLNPYHGSAAQDLELIRRVFCSLTYNIAQRLIDKFSTIDQNELTFELTADERDIIDAIKQEMATKNLDFSNNLIIKMVDVIAEFHKLQLKIFCDLQIKDWYNQVYNVNWKNPEDQLSFISITENNTNIDEQYSANWLSKTELESLIKTQKETDNNILNNVDIVCIQGDVKQQFRVDSSLRAIVQKFKNLSYKGYAILLICYENHWATCVINKDKHKVPNFTIADSHNFKDRAKEDKITNLINMFTQARIFVNRPQTNNQENVNTSSNKFTDKLLRLDLLLNKDDEKQGLGNVRDIITRLKAKKEGLTLQGLDIEQNNLLVYGPAQTGKSSLAYTISKLAQVGFIGVEARDLVNPEFFNKTNNITNISNDNKEYDQSFDSLIDSIKGVTPIIFFIHRLDGLITKSESGESKAALVNYILEKINEYKSSSSICFIFSSHLDPRDYPNRLDLVAFNIISIKMDLPGYRKRHDIIKYYIEHFVESIIKEYKDKKIAPNDYLMKSLTKGSRKFNCRDIKDFIFGALLAMRSGNATSDNSTWLYKYNNSLDFKNRPINSTCTWIWKGFTAALPDDEYCDVLYSFCRLKKACVDLRDSEIWEEKFVNNFIKDYPGSVKRFKFIWKYGGGAACKAFASKGLDFVADEIGAHVYKEFREHVSDPRKKEESSGK